MPDTSVKPGTFGVNIPAYFLYNLAVATIGPLLFGYHLAELNAPQKVITCEVKTYAINAYLSPLPKCIPMSTFEIGLVSSIFTIGGLLGALSAGYAATKYGRLNSMRGNTLLFTLGPLAEACAPNMAVMAIGRFVSGMGAGAAVVIVPIYISEIAPPHQKGFYGAFTQVTVNMGILITQTLGLFLSKSQLWRIILGVGGAIGLNQLAGLFFAIESPKWTADHGKVQKAKADLQKLRGANYDIHEEVRGWGAQSADRMEGMLLLDSDKTAIRLHSFTGEEEALLDDAPEEAERNCPSPRGRETVKKGTVGFFRILVHPRYSRAVVAVMVVMVAQQLCGINSIVMYGVSVLAELLPTSSAILNVCLAALNLIVTLAGAPLVDRLGRKPCLIASICGMGISSLLLGIAIKNGIVVLSAIAVLTFVASFGVGLGPIPFILSSELVDAEAVGTTQSWALAANWLSTFVVAQFFPVLNQKLGKGVVYFIFAALAAGFAAFVAWWVPETKGKRDLEQVWGWKASGEHDEHERND